MPWLDIIDSYIDYTAKQRSPELFRKWAAISITAAAMERRIWAKIGGKPIYPNLWVMLVAPPGIGKGEAIIPAAELIRETGEFFVAPDSVNSASIMDSYLNSYRCRTIDEKTIVEYHSLFACAEELGFFMAEYNQEFMSRLVTLYNNPPQVEIQRIYRGQDAIRIVNPQLNFLGGTQPGFLNALIPEVGWTMGFMSRFMLVYASAGPTVELDPFRQESEELGLDSPIRGKLVAQLAEIGKGYGQMKWEARAGNALKEWDKVGGRPRPTHSRLHNYSARRTTIFVTKLAMVSAVARSGDMMIELEDFQRAQSWMIEAEALMPDIFRDMQGKSDLNLVLDLHHYLLTQFNAGGKKPMEAQILWSFLAAKAPSQIIPRVIDMACRMGNIKSDGLGKYIPRPLYQNEME